MAEAIETQRPEKPREWAKDIDVAIFDFDGTIANTFEKSPTGINVFKATEIAVGNLFGEGGLKRLEAIGGPGNNSPGELVRKLFDGLDMESGSGETFVAKAHTYFLDNQIALYGTMPHGKGTSIAWDTEPKRLATQSPEEYRTRLLMLFTELFVRAKLIAFLDPQWKVFQLSPDGKVWPAPFDGVIAFIRALLAKGVPVAILSAGHDSFIRTAFKAWGFTEEEIKNIRIVSDDDLRRLDIPAEDKMKPSVFLAHLAHSLLIRHKGGSADPRKVGYFGDDDIRDGKLAESAKMRFGWYRPKPTEEELKNPDVFSDWRELAKALR